MTSKENIWDLFDKKFCINLVSRDDKYEHCKKEFEKNNVKNVEFFRPHKHPVDGSIGCYESHMHVVNKSLEEGYDKVLIFEDDIHINKINHKEWVEKLEHFFEKYKNWEILSFCYARVLKFSRFFRSSRKTNIANIYFEPSILAHCYAVSRRGMEKIVKMKFNDKIGIDNHYALYIKNFYSIYPEMVIQKENFKSDIQTFFLLKPNVKSKLLKINSLQENTVFCLFIAIIGIIIFLYILKTIRIK